LQNFELVAQGEVLKGELPSRAKTTNERKKEDFEHPGMLCSVYGNRNGGNADGVFGRDR
jgi:hypothetical protein